MKRLETSATDLTGRTSLSELAAQLRRCRLLLTNDTGTMHLAAFLGVPTVAIFGSTEPQLTGPIGEGHVVIRHHVECSPCFLRECPLDFRCMKAVTVEEAVSRGRAECWGRKWSVSVPVSVGIETWVRVGSFGDDEILL